MSKRTLILVDGENLVAGFERTRDADNFLQPRADVVHMPDQFVWHWKLGALDQFEDLLRVSYLTTIVGNEEKVNALRSLISMVPARIRKGAASPETLVPHVFVKPKRGGKNKSVDINLTVEALRHAYNRTADQIVIVSGDGDYLPVIQEVMRQGVTVWGAAFKDGLNPHIRPAVDAFIELELLFFQARDPGPRQEYADL
ncbi:MAG: NYN domain-containing protein [bacterium]|nr:NYN domain-containing protein [bacterium]